MGNIKIGDIVSRKSYGGDVFFRVVDIVNCGDKKIVSLKGISYRIEADAPESDLILQSERDVLDYTRAAAGKVDNNGPKTNASAGKRFFVKRSS